jgi:polyferredoxin
MSIFELIFFGMVVAAIFFASRWLGTAIGISAWFVAAPLAVGAFFGLRQLGRWLAGRRADPWPFERGRNRED